MRSLPEKRKKEREGSACHKSLWFCIPFTHFLSNPITSTFNMRPITNRDAPQHGPNLLILLYLTLFPHPTPSLFPFLPIPYLFRSLLRRLPMHTFVLYTVSGVGRCGCYIREWHDRWGSSDKTFLRTWTWWTHTWRKEKGICLLSLDTYVNINMTNVANHDHRDL